MTVTSSNAADVARLTEVIARQRRELGQLRAEAALRSLLDTARGMLMERLGCPAAEAGQQLARLAREAGVPLADLAAEVTGQHAEVLTSQHVMPGTGAAAAAPAGGLGRAARQRLGRAAAAAQVAADGDGIAAAAFDELLRPAGAAAVMLWLLGPDGSLDLAGQAGLDLAEAARWQHLPPSMDCLPQRVVRRGTEIAWSAGPPPGEPVPLPGRWPAGARAVLPMRPAGTIVGAISALWPAPLPEFEPALIRQLAAVADLCAQLLTAQEHDGELAGPPLWLYGLLDGVIESALFASPVRAADGTVIDFQIGHVSSDFRDPAGRSAASLAGRPLLEAYPLAGLPGGLFEQAVKALRTGRASHASGGILTALVSDAGVTPVMDTRIARLFDGVVIAWRRVDDAERLASLLQHAERLGRIGGWEENLLTGEVRWSESALTLLGRPPGQAIPLAGLHEHVVAEDRFGVEQFRGRLLRENSATAAAFRLIRPDDQSVRQFRVFAEPVTGPLGDVVAVRGAFQDVSTHYHTQVALTATRDRLADTEERAQEERRLAARLQEAITPWSSEPVGAAGLDVVARYRPAGPARLVSGDWYDTVVLPDGRVLLVVGDIAGHGIDAVTGMVEMRNCLRGLAITGAGPARLLSWLNAIACHLTEGTIGTAVCGLYDQPSRTLRWARAGHLPPVLVRGGVARELPPAGGLMLGADPGGRYEEVTTSLQPGDLLLLFTDGLVERRDMPIDDTVCALLRSASRPVGSITEYADHLLCQADANTGDDACLVAVRVR